MAQGTYLRAEKEEKLERVKAVYGDIVKAGDCVSLKTLAVSGKDLMEAGMKPGKEMGEMLQKLLEAVLEEPGKNTKEELLKLYEYFLPSFHKIG